MALVAKKDRGTYLNVLNSDGTLRMVVDETTPGAVRRDWESGDGKTSGTKWELIFQTVSGIVSSVEMYEGDYGKNLIIGLTDGDDPEIKVSFSMNSAFGEDMAKKLPALDLTQKVELSPFSFEDDNGKTRKGVSVVQDGKKVQNYFYDFHEKKAINGFPTPAFKKDKKTGELKPFSKDEWKIYFAQVRQFLIEYIEEHHLIAPKNELDEAMEDRKKLEKYYPKAPVEDVTFEAVPDPTEPTDAIAF